MHLILVKMSEWKIPPRIKIYEALGCIADKRIEILKDKAKVFSSSSNKFYEVIFNEKENSITSNDNGSYWQGYLGYPSIAFLMLTGKIIFDKKYTEAFKGIRWKDMNVKFKRNYDQTEEFVLAEAEKIGFNKKELLVEIEKIISQINNLHINRITTEIKPPQEY